MKLGCHRDFHNNFHPKCESASRLFQPGGGPSRGLLCDCTTSAINRLQQFDIKHTNIHQANAKQTQLTAASSPDAIMPTILSQSLVGPALKHDR